MLTYTLLKTVEYVLFCTQKRKTMNSFFSVYDAYKNQTNIYSEVKNFDSKEHHSPNFKKVMSWLKESIQVQDSAYIDEVTTVLILTTGDGTLKLTAEITANKCVMTEVKPLRKKN